MIQTAVRPAVSAKVQSKAERLVGEVEYQGGGIFTVRGETDRYVVKAPYGERNPEKWTCDCSWGRYGGKGNTRGTMCSHVRAADIWLNNVAALR
jgi:hypothetical protein